MQVDSTAQDCRLVFEDHAHRPAWARLRGWLWQRIRHSPGSIWTRVDLADFCDCTGLSMRTARYALKRLRDENHHGFKFRTLFRRETGAKGAWQIYVADASQLTFDKEPLFNTRQGRPRHVRPQLREKPIAPPQRPQRAAEEGEKGGSRETTPSTTPPRSKGLRRRSECNALLREPKQRKDINPPLGESGGVRPRWKPREPSPEGLARLRSMAHGVARRELGAEHWDNCRIGYQHHAAFGYALRSLRDGHSVPAIVGAYRSGLKRAHGFAVDQEAPHGAFTPASTLSHAYEILSRDRRTVGERVAAFYENRREELAAWKAALAEAGEAPPP